MTAQDPYQTPEADITPPATEYVPPSTKELLFSFQGRIPRRIYWAISIALAVIFYVPQIIMAVAGDNTTIVLLMSVIILIMAIPGIWIGLGASVKRWHDRNKSGWWVLIGLIPIVGAIWTLVECGCLRGTEGPNEYGADPT
jgi:uncharacterized membrane protein YhaH (DUF805 family)